MLSQKVERGWSLWLRGWIVILGVGGLQQGILWVVVSFYVKYSVTHFC